MMVGSDTRLQYADQFNAASWKSILENVGHYGALKVGVGLCAIGLDWLFGTSKELVLSIALLIALDTFTGLWKAIKTHNWSSRGFFRFSTKCLVYFLILATGALVDKALPTPVALAFFCTFLAVTEGISVLENLRDLGFTVPSHFIHKLRSVITKQSEKQKTEPKK